MKFSAKKFLSDRDKSTERSRKGELANANLLPSSQNHTAIKGVIETMRKRSHPLNTKAETCNHKLALGCNLSRNKRTKPECDACL